jgi:hypothetical protein
MSWTKTRHEDGAMEADLDMPFDPHVEAFVQSAIRLPHSRLRQIDRQWDRLQNERRVVSEVVQGNNEIRLQMGPLRDYITIAARMAEATGIAETGPSSMLVEEVVEAILPAARAVLMRDLLQKSPTPERAAAFAALTAPFRDLLPIRE